MRRTVFLTLGLLEFAVAGVLSCMSFQLPRDDEVEQSFASAERVTRRSSSQVQLSRQQIRDLRAAELRQLAQRLHAHTQNVTAHLRDQQVDYATVRSLRDSLGGTADGLDGLGDRLEAARFDRLADSLGETASYLDEGVVPAAEKTADELETSTAGLRANAKNLSVLLRTAPPDLKAAREIHDGLARFGEGLERMSTSLQVKRLKAMREGFGGLETALNSGAGQVDRLAGYTYPEVTFNGWKPRVSYQPFWPEGGEIAGGLRKAAAGVTAAGQELDDLAADLPEIQASLKESRKAVERTRASLANALRQQEKLEQVLKETPGQAAALAETLPRLAEDLTRLLRGTRRLRDVAASLRRAQKGLESAQAQSPEVRKTLASSAAVLRTARGRMDQVLRQRRQYEAALSQTVVLADTLSTLLRDLADRLAARLDEQDRGLDELGQSIDEVSTALPVYQRTTTHVLQTSRLLLWLVAAVVALHGGYLVLSVRMGRRYSL